MQALLVVCANRWNRATSPEDLVSAVPGMGMLRASHFADALRAAEATAAQRRQRSITLTGNLEADATGLRQLVLKRTNSNFSNAVQALEKKLPKPESHYRCWVRILGLCERKTRKLILAPIPDKVVTLKAKPPPESKQEIEESGLLQHIRRPAKVYSDGALSWPPVLRARNLPFAETCHQNHQYTKELAGGSRKFSKLAGTQCLDRRWGVLCNDYVPKTLNAKSRNEDGSHTN
ncbi:unnamed protein product, partial [Symbiodinium sp. KB8]